MNRRLSGDASLNAPIRADSNPARGRTGSSTNPRPRSRCWPESEELANRKQLLKNALGVLNDRERRIFEARRLSDDPITLEDLSSEFGVSRERVRQIEVRAFEKVQEAVRDAAREMERPRRELESPHAALGA